MSGSHGYRDGFDDDDDYVEYTLPPKPAPASRPTPAAAPRPPRPAPPPRGRGERRRLTPEESWRGQLEDMTSTTEIQPIRDVPNGSRGEEDRRFNPVEKSPPRERRPVAPEQPFFDDLDTYGGSSPHDNRRNGTHHPPPNRRRRLDPDEGPGRR